MSKKSYSVVIKNKIKSFKKIISVDSDKSLSIRYLLIGAISEGISEIRSILESDDVFSCIYCLKKLGVKIRKSKEKKYLIYGKGLGSLHIKKGSTLNFGNSGTLARLLIGILSSTPNIEVKIKGDSSLNKRSMSKLISLMNEFGAEFYPKRKVNFPLKIVSSAIPVGINYNAGVSAQLKSAVILAGLNSYGVTNIFEQHKSRDHTENILEKNSTTLKKKNKNIKIYGKSFLNSIKVFVPGDPSSAAFMTSTQSSADLSAITERTALLLMNIFIILTVVIYLSFSSNKDRDLLSGKMRDKAISIQIPNLVGFFRLPSSNTSAAEGTLLGTNSRLGIFKISSVI